jgi:hypothetical protein
MNRVCTQHILLKLIQCQAYNFFWNNDPRSWQILWIFFYYKKTKNAQRYEWKKVQKFITLDVDQVVLLYIMRLIYQHLLLCCLPFWVWNSCRCLPKQKKQNKYNNEKHTPTCNVILFFSILIQCWARFGV